MATADQEREYVAQLEGRSIESVKRMLAQNEIPPAFVFPVSQWVSDKELQLERRSDAAISEQTELARRAADAAERAAAAAEEQASEARRANTKATIALITAIVFPIITTIVAVIGI